ncbi:MAG: CHAT domain-containing protein [Oscillatoria sp. SIO1A7]|nr:CHAT domain-containing protein [Oscillatoria sp. SIO1A7]
MKNQPVITAIVVLSVSSGILGAIAPKALGGDAPPLASEADWQSGCTDGQNSLPCYSNNYQTDNLKNSLATSTTAPSSSTAASINKEQQAEQLYAIGRLAEAAQLLQEIRGEYANLGDDLGLARVLRNLALVYLETGPRSEAAEIIAQSLSLLCGDIACDISQKNGRKFKKLIAEVLEVQGKLQFSAGNAEAALDTWKQAALFYEKIEDITGVTRSEIHQTQALRRLGLYRQAIDTLRAIDESLAEQPDSLLKAQALHRLGDALRLVGREQESKKILEKSLAILMQKRYAYRAASANAIAEKLPYASSIASVMLSLGNTARESGQDRKSALDFYEQAALDSPSLDLRLKAQLNILSLLVEDQDFSEMQKLISEIQSNLTQLPLSRTAVNARINLASRLMDVAMADGQCPVSGVWSKSVNKNGIPKSEDLPKPPLKTPSAKKPTLLQGGVWGRSSATTFDHTPVSAKHLKDRLSAKADLFLEMLRPDKIESQKSNLEAKNSFCNVANAELLATAVKMARALEDKRAESYSLGVLGRLYEQNQQWDNARSLTEQALFLAQGMNAGDIAYQWQWQLGRIMRVQGNREGAIAAYSQSVDTLKSLRGDLVAISSKVQFNFKETVEPVYRELVALLLEPSKTKHGKGAPSQAEIMKARETIEALQLAELDNFFRDACLEVQANQIDDIDPKAAVVYTIILPNRLEAIVTLPGKSLRHYSIPLPQKEVERTIQKMRLALTNIRLRRAVRNFLPHSQEVYNWLIRPIETDLAASEIDTLVFVLDGAFRNIPIAALHDGEKYLTEKYNLALTPGLQLLDSRNLVAEELQTLSAGLTEARQGFAELPGVGLELQSIASSLPAEILLNRYFTKSNFQATLNSFAFPLIHIATHGQFSSRAADTFILTWDDRINVVELDTILRADERKKNPIELLVLSACQTAVGDRRAALGLAGVAVRAGARSTVGSLWYVSDESTTMLMSEFYQQLAQPNAKKAESLRRAQIAILQDHKFSHPYFWSAFVLVGNWQ